MEINNCTFVKSVFTWDSGGGVEVDLIELNDGKILMISNEAVCIYKNMEDAESGNPIESKPFILL